MSGGLVSRRQGCGGVAVIQGPAEVGLLWRLVPAVVGTGDSGQRRHRWEERPRGLRRDGGRQGRGSLEGSLEEAHP